MCAVFTLYNLGFFLVLCFATVVIMQFLCTSIFDLLTGVFVFLIDVQATESVNANQ
jgi:hypothetical protein